MFTLRQRFACLVDAGKPDDVFKFAAIELLDLRGCGHEEKEDGLCFVFAKK